MRRFLILSILILGILIQAGIFRGMCPYTEGDVVLKSSEVVASLSRDGILENLALASNGFDSLMSLEVMLNRKRFSVESSRLEGDLAIFEGEFGPIQATLKYRLVGDSLKVYVVPKGDLKFAELKLLIKTCDFEPLIFRGKGVHMIQGRHVAYAVNLPGSLSLYTAGMMVVVKRETNIPEDFKGFEFSVVVARDVETLRKRFGLSGTKEVVRKVLDEAGKVLRGVNIAVKVDRVYTSVAAPDEEGYVRFEVPEGEVGFEVLGEDVRLKDEGDRLILGFPGYTSFRWEPYLTGLGTDSIYVAMRLTRPGTVLVELGDREYEDELMDTFHMVRIEDLKPGEVYGVRVSTLDDESHLRVRLPTSEFSFAVYGDTRTNEKWHEMVCNAMSKEEISFVVHTGDLVESGDLIHDWDDFFKASRALYSKVPIVPTLGNHERNSPYYYQAFMAPKGGGDFYRRWYSVVIGNVRFVVLDSNVARGSAQDKRQLEWLEDVLKSSKERFKIVVFHHPFFTNAPNREPNHREDWQRIFEKYGVQLVLNGHIHHYERFLINGVMYVTTGGGGAPLGFGLKSSRRTHIKGTKAGEAGYLHYLVGKVRGDEIEFIVKSVAKYDWGRLEVVRDVLDRFTIRGR